MPRTCAGCLNTFNEVGVLFCCNASVRMYWPNMTT